MGDFVFYMFMLVLLAVAVGACVFVLRGYLAGSLPTTMLFGPRPERRLAVIDQANVDGRRRLLLIRRDDVEHLIMTGGPVDVVIETGIGAPAQPQATPDSAAAVYSRPARALGQTKTEQAAE
jgi:hypothetical protein